jgi:hypothetical protein
MAQRRGSGFLRNIKSKLFDSRESVNMSNQSLETHPSRSFPYSVALIDSSFQFPLAVPQSLCHTLDGLRTTDDLFARARRIYDLLYSQTTYDIGYFQSQNQSRPYAKGSDVWKSKKGVCGELAFLYVGCARYLGIDASYVRVSQDNGGRSVQHACAGLFFPSVVRAKHNLRSHPFFVDLAYHSFGISHQTYSVLSDSQVFELYTQYVSSWQNAKRQRR